MTLPVAMAGKDIIGQAKTGTGKTFGFGLPMLERITVAADVDAGRAGADQLTTAPQGLVVVPTRELCVQVTNDLETAGKVRGVRVLAIYGGRAYEPQVEALARGVDIVVGTPGRLLDLARQRKLDLSAVRMLVLDEADEMLDLGFLPDVEKIIAQLPARRQTMLFSATMPGQVISLARRYMDRPTHIRATAPDDTGATVAAVKQHVYRAHSLDKPELLSRVLQARGRGLTMIFCRTKRTAADLADQLTRRGFAAAAVHGDLGQGAREQALRAFRGGKVDVLVATDVAARGIDVEGVTHVVNYQCPEDEKTYLHRIGRTGRAGASGIAITLVDWDDVPRWQLVNKALGLDFNDPPETYSTSAHLFADLDIPEDATGVLPRAERTRAGLGAEEIEDLGETGGRTRSGGRGRSGTRAGSRSGGRSGAEGGRSTGPDEGTEAAAGEEEQPRQRRPRGGRRRTRAGQPLEAATADGTQSAAPASDEAAGRALDTVREAEGAATATTEAAGTAPAEAGGTAESPTTPAPRRRARTRTRAGRTAGADTPAQDGAADGGASDSDAPGTAEAGAAAPAAEAAEAPARGGSRAKSATAVADAEGLPAPRRRRRTRRSGGESAEPTTGGGDE
ncbi:DEAD/DEAH box helicase [Allostreptomyces psammosilenae]|uniref:RNA helicase n=1 Tax=Allostreptomyces psammosilenae TaxID=1892865 RepID=A0A853A164_9ACTN|nr:DEAD/DEAH box helicase [Allostreptomyces psammosilenae]NYI08109.1 superfamily II DNA/RNA helicase [Allostreptomyces psammosilenae]